MMRIDMLTPFATDTQLDGSYNSLYDYDIEMTCDGDLLTSEEMNTVVGRVIISLPFDVSVVSEGEFESGRRQIMFTSAYAGYVSGDFGYVDPVDIISVDYINGVITFQVDHLTLFTVGDVRDDDSDENTGASSGGGGCHAGGTNQLLILFTILGVYRLLRYRKINGKGWSRFDSAFFIW